MARLRHVNCPQCGGTLGLGGAERVVRCRYCQTPVLVEAPEIIPEYYLKPRLSEVEARRGVQTLLREKDMPASLLKQSRFHSARLYFIPYHELTARRLGTMTVTEVKKTPLSQLSGENRWPSAMNWNVKGRNFPSRLPPELGRATEKVKDTRVIMADVQRIEPAVSLPGWGLEEAEIAALRSQPEGKLYPFDRTEMERLGRIYLPSPERRESREAAGRKAPTALLEDQTDLSEVRLKRIYYPVWRIRYQYQGRLYSVTLDGITGRVMAGRAPKDDRSRILWLLATSSVVAFLVGKILHGFIGPLFLHPQNFTLYLHLMTISIQITLPFILLGLLVAAAVLALGWEQFRYPGEIVIAGSRRWVEKINRPERTAFDRIMELGERVGKALVRERW